MNNSNKKAVEVAERGNTINIVGIIVMILIAILSPLIEYLVSQHFFVQAEYEHSIEMEITPAPDTQIPTPDSPMSTSTPEIATTSIPLSDFTNIAPPPTLQPHWHGSIAIDNFRNEYSKSFIAWGDVIGIGTKTFTTIINEDFSRFQATFFIWYGETSDKTARLRIILDDEEVHTASLGRLDRPIPIDICVTGRTVFTIELESTTRPFSIGITSGIGNPVFIP